MNYIISETQLQSIVDIEKPSEAMSLRTALKKIVEVMSLDGYEPEQIVDFILGLRYQDEFTKKRAEKYYKTEGFKDAVDRILEN